MKSLSFLLVALTACGSTQDLSTGTNTGAAGSAAKPAAGGDISLELDKIEIKGVTFDPEALGRPGMPLVEPKKKTTIEKQRQVFATTKDPLQKEAHAAILATLLYQKAKDDKANEKALWTEARQALRDAAAASGAKVDEITLRLLGSYELLFEDYGAAEKAWGDLVKAAPKDKDVQYNRAWWVYALLKQFKNADALEAVKAEVVTDKQPELAYVTAWAKWRAGDQAGAWQAIVAAGQGWGSSGGRQELDRDIMLFAGRAAVPFAQVEPQLYAVFNAKQNPQRYEVLAKLGLQGYGFAGRWADGVAALDKAIGMAGNTIPPNDLPVIRYAQADFTVRLDAPDAAAKFAKQALEALPACGAKCTPQQQQEIVISVSIMARLFHILYATANDIRYYQPANDLYVAAIPAITEAARRTQVNNDATTLQRTLKNTKAGTGTHDKGAIGALLQRHNQEVQACYEAGLAANPKLGGTVVVSLDADVTGAVSGVATEPKAGQADLAAVAGCIEKFAKSWRLPRRGMPGATRVKLPYVMSPKK